MYKTVRHGDNSLQYKILAQQEEGTANVKYRRSKKGKAAGIFTVVVLLVCGVIASAVLVPLILTDDFITLTGTFQKYSVSTLRRTHSGNHIVVIAKKPHGWNGSRHALLQPFAHAKNVSRNNSKEELPGKESPTNSSLALHSTPAHSSSENEGKVTQRHSFGNYDEKNLKLDSTTLATSAQNQEATIQKGKEASLARPDKFEKVKSASNASAAAPPPTGQRQSRWNLQFPESFLRWSKSTILNHPLSAAVSGFTIVSLILVLFVVSARRIFCKRSEMKKKSSALKEDKTRLLKTSARGSDED